MPTFVFSALFIGLENYRNELIAAFKESGHKITAPDLPVFRQMYTSAPEIVSDLTTFLKSKSLITISHENHIRGIKTNY